MSRRAETRGRQQSVPVVIPLSRLPSPMRSSLPGCRGRSRRRWHRRNREWRTRAPTPYLWLPRRARRRTVVASPTSMGSPHPGYLGHSPLSIASPSVTKRRMADGGWRTRAPTAYPWSMHPLGPCMRSRDQPGSMATGTLAPPWKRWKSRVQCSVFSVQCPVSSPNTVTGPRSSLPDFSVRPPAEDPTPTLVPPSTTFRCLLTRRRR